MFPNRQKFNLDGIWTVVPDPNQQGEAEEWFNTPPLGHGIEIQVPQIEPIPPQFNPITTTLWYFREFEIQEIPDNKLLFLYLSNVNFSASLWLNNNYIGKHLGGAFSPFQIHITKYIKPGKNFLAIKLSPFSKIEETYHKFIYDSSWLNYPGIWGDVYLEQRDLFYIQKVCVRSDIMGKMLIINAHTNQKGGTYTVKIPELGVDIKHHLPKIVIPLKKFDLWDPDSPILYDITVEYQNENNSDLAKVKFGMRDFSVRQNYFIFNFKPFFVKALDFDWNYKDINTDSLSEKIIRENLLIVKKLGYNFLFTHGKPLPNKVLTLCDEIGILVSETPSLKYSQNHHKWQKVVEREIDEIVTNQINHPSLVWFQIEDASETPEPKSLIHFFRKIDRSRFISIQHKDSGNNDTFCFCPPYKVDLSPMKYISIKPQQYTNNATRLFLEHVCNDNILHFAVKSIDNVISENECDKNAKGNILEKYYLQIKQGFEERDLNLSLNSFENLLEQIKEIYLSNIQTYIDTCYQHRKIAGHCISTLNRPLFLEAESLLDTFKNSTELLQKFSSLNNNLRISLSLEKQNLTQGEESPVVISLPRLDNKIFINSDADESEIQVGLTVQILSPANQVLWKKKKKNIKIKKDTTDLWQGDISGSSNIGNHLLVAQLSIDNNVVSEVKLDYYVAPTPTPIKIPVEIIDPTNYYEKICSEWIDQNGEIPHIYILPPISNTIFGYPDKEILMMLEQVRYGAIGIVFSPPDDWNRLKEIFPDCPEFTTIDLNNYPDCSHFHYVKPHPIFLNLPNRCLMKKPFNNIISSKVIAEKGDEDICGCVVFPHQDEIEPFWANDILVQRYGIGKLVFTHLHILENISIDPLATHIFTNMATYFSRRAIPSEEPLPIPQSSVEWFRSERDKYFRKWLVIGEFPIPKSEEDTYYPSFKNTNLSESFYGKYGVNTWKPWYTNKKNNHFLNFHQALTIPLHPSYLEQDNGIAFAFAEFNYEDNKEVIVQVKTTNRIKLWLNNSKIIENPIHSNEVQILEAKVTLKRWKNNIFIECVKEKGNHGFSIQFYDTKRNQLDINW
ncbi:MAG TPA: glycoside hydrolase family 2 TIM barrel-domain containing protein [Candidatus Hydrogenedens sp.]|nr:glycoside hydrolase family 2 TIM barrel-domain containing protein [Candidatus Hydrogenedens sp.]HOL18875.1 glycoside hydrolase family 2 TIM barrel-domain containing protein [Candidatus Hydrogenedens sp.]HPP57625.1 glycoside hydrolase family 2 TIM barrel-domain containing protein [Candidatus Hydrogenedens sp.]